MHFSEAFHLKVNSCHNSYNGLAYFDDKKSRVLLKFKTNYFLQQNAARLVSLSTAVKSG